MSLLLVRHAQASFGSANYDQLSPLGWTQAEALGRYLAREPHVFTSVRVGAMQRHRETLHAIGQAFADSGHALPPINEDPDLNEFDHGTVIQAYLAQRACSDMRLRAQSKESAVIGPMLLAALGAWADDALDGVTESWGVFGERVTRAGEAAAAASAEGATLVVSSGGVIARLAQQALGVPAQVAVELNIAIRNASINEFHAGPGRLRMASFNTLPHLAHDRRLWTHF